MIKRAGLHTLSSPVNLSRDRIEYTSFYVILCHVETQSQDDGKKAPLMLCI